jgi:hypothetical protein
MVPTAFRETLPRRFWQIKAQRIGLALRKARRHCAVFHILIGMWKHIYCATVEKARQ